MLVWIFLGVALTSCTADAGPTLEEDQEALRALAARTLQAEISEDLEGWLETITEDAVLLTTDGPVAGKDAIRERLAGSFGNYDWEGDWALEEIDVSGDLAVMWGPMETTLTPRGGGASSTTVGYHLDVARRQSDGSWRFTWWTTKTRPVTEPARN